MRDIPAAPHVVRVISHLLQPRQVSADGHTAYDIVLLDLPPDDSPDALPILRERLARRARPDRRAGRRAGVLRRRPGGERADLQRSEVISLPLAALALLLVFGSLVAAGVPLVVGGTGVLVALAAIFLVASVTPMSIFVLNLATLLGLGLGVDYSLLLTSRFREELAERPADEAERVAEAVRITVATAGRAVFFSGLTVLLGLLGPRPVRVHDPALGRASPGRSSSAFAVLAALTLLPALLALFGRRLDRFAVRRVRRRDPARRPVGAARPAGHAPPGRGPRPDPRASCCCSARRSCTSGSTRRTRASCPPSVPSRAAFDRLRDAFGEGEFAPIAIAVRTDGPATGPANLAAPVRLHRGGSRPIRA